MLSQADKLYNCLTGIVNILGNYCDMDVANLFLTNASKERILNGFIERSAPYWGKIYEKDIDFLVENFETIFGFPGDDHTDEILAHRDSTDMAMLWKLLHTCVKICIVHLHNNGNVISRKEFEKWNIKLK